VGGRFLEQVPDKGLGMARWKITRTAEVGPGFQGFSGSSSSGPEQIEGRDRE
jgi:hypothetical protein